MNASANRAMSRNALRCFYCNRFMGDHKAITLHCPIGRKHRTHGFSGFHRENTYMTALGQRES